MKMNEVATQVKVMDGGKNYYYWVTQSKETTAKRAAIKKHCNLMGVNSNLEKLTAEILPAKDKSG